eukprot:TRINITY_DN1773_c0_g1_i1.p1 TRINITY_DN1773_c0_g1~~TRINITY_DN1773_c0_g1_i1.p1  ORF type:complete len:198 (+),score=15.07 TRINITY_DN1773_c0_g1_i1:50-643(+)
MCIRDRYQRRVRAEVLVGGPSCFKISFWFPRAWETGASELRGATMSEDCTETKEIVQPEGVEEDKLAAKVKEFQSKIQTALEEEATHFRYLKDIGIPALVSSLKALTLLQSLSLCCHPCRSLQFYSFLTHLPLLEELRLSSFPLPELPPEVCKLTKLKKLGLYGSKLHCIPPEIGELKNLVHPFEPLHFVSLALAAI